MRVLSLDAGNLQHGVILCATLADMERRTGRQIYELFDVIFGISSGGILAMTLGLLKMRAVDCLDIFNSLANDVYAHPCLVKQHGSKYDETRLERVLAKHFGIRRLLSDFSPNLDNSSSKRIPHVLIVSKRIDVNPTRSFMFSNSTDFFRAKGLAPGADEGLFDGTDQMTLWETARATMAFPLLFRPFRDTEGRVHIDGTFASSPGGNPSMIAIQQVARVFQIESIEIFVSVGSGAVVLPGEKKNPGFRTIVDVPSYVEVLHDLAVGPSPTSSLTNNEDQVSTPAILSVQSIRTSKRKSGSHSTNPSPKSSTSTSGKAPPPPPATSSSSTSTTGANVRKFFPSRKTSSSTNDNSKSNTSGAASTASANKSNAEKKKSESGDMVIKTSVDDEFNSSLWPDWATSQNYKYLTQTVLVLNGTIEFLSNSTMDGDQVHLTLSCLLNTTSSLMPRYYRLNPPLKKVTPLDEASEKSLSDVALQISTYWQNISTPSNLYKQLTIQKEGEEDRREDF